MWDIPGKENKLWLKEVTEVIKCGKRIIDIETTGGKLP